VTRRELDEQIAALEQHLAWLREQRAGLAAGGAAEAPPCRQTEPDAEAPAPEEPAAPPTAGDLAARAATKREEPRAGVTPAAARPAPIEQPGAAPEAASPGGEDPDTVLARFSPREAAGLSTTAKIGCIASAALVAGLVLFLLFGLPYLLQDREEAPAPTAEDARSLYYEN